MDCECVTCEDCVFQAVRTVGGRRFAICRGTSELPRKRQEDYVEKWAKQEGKPAPERKTNCDKTKSQVGTKLKEIIKREYGAIACSECESEVKKLNRMTPDEIEADRDALIERMAERAPKIAPKWWQRLGAKLCPNEVKRQCGEMLDEALAAENQQQERTGNSPGRSDDKDDSTHASD